MSIRPAAGKVKSQGFTYPALHARLVSLFDGNPAVTAIYKGDIGFRPDRAMPLSSGISLHLSGGEICGVYPWAPGNCGCPPERHDCEGLGSRFLVVDIDDHDKTGDAYDRALSLLETASRHNLIGHLCSSRSGQGYWVYFFLDRHVPTTALFAVGTVLANRSGLLTRRDVFPSANHAKLGTLIALPLSPLYPAGCGWPITDDYKTPASPSNVDSLLLSWDGRRNSASVVSAIYDSLPRVSRPQYGKSYGESWRRATCSSISTLLLLSEMGEYVPEIRDLFASDMTSDRSRSELRLASIMLRQGAGEDRVVSALMDLGLKSHARGEDYARENIIDYLKSTKKRNRSEQTSKASPSVISHRNPSRTARVPGSRSEHVSEADVLMRVVEAHGKLRKAIRFLVVECLDAEKKNLPLFLSIRRLAEHVGCSTGTAHKLKSEIAESYRHVFDVRDGSSHRKYRAATSWRLNRGVPEDAPDTSNWLQSLCDMLLHHSDEPGITEGFIPWDVLPAAAVSAFKSRLIDGRPRL